MFSPWLGGVGGWLVSALECFCRAEGGGRGNLGCFRALVRGSRRTWDGDREESGDNSVITAGWL